MSAQDERSEHATQQELAVGGSSDVVVTREGVSRFNRKTGLWEGGKWDGFKPNATAPETKRDVKAWRNVSTTHYVSKQPTEAQVLAVHRQFHKTMLKDICERDQMDFFQYGQRWDFPDHRGDPHFYYYQDNGSDILGIAHLDTVQKNRDCGIIQTNNGLFVASGGLDDRLGAYVILDLLPRLDITVDWLLTTNEESAHSSAGDFKLADVGVDKEYKWMFQFDRGGTDVVMYQYETSELRKLVQECGAQVGTGSFSDICMLSGLGCSGLNWGVGYRDYHGAKSHAWLDDTFRMVARFVKFHEANKDSALPYVVPTYQSGRYFRHGDGGKNVHGRWDKNGIWRYDKEKKGEAKEPLSLGPGSAVTDRELNDDYEQWWKEVTTDWVEADCGCYIDVNSKTSYTTMQGFTVCNKCCLEYGW